MFFCFFWNLEKKQNDFLLENFSSLISFLMFLSLERDLSLF